MLPRASLLLVAIGITAVAAASYNTDYRTDGYGRTDRTYNDRNYPRNDQNYDRRGPFDQNNYPQNYNQNNGANNYNYNRNNNNRQNNYDNYRVYTKNETAIFCYINATRLENQRAQYNAGPSMEIEPRLCTHLIIGAAVLNRNTRSVRLLNDEILSRQGIGSLSYDKISELRRENQNLKILLSISGPSADWADLVKSSRDTLIRSIVAICKNNKVGVNIDWQWPERKREHEMEMFFQFLLELKNELRGLVAVSHELSVFLPAEHHQLVDILQARATDNNNYEMVMEYVDYWILMAVELRGHWDQRIEHHAPIDSYSGSRTTVRKAINDVRNYAPPDFLYKFVLAIPFYGKRYQLATRSDRESPMNKLQQKLHTSYSYDDILKVPYNKICYEIAQPDFQLDYDETNGCPYAYHDNTVFVYEDIKSVKAKTRLAIANGFGGVMAYSIEMDDTTGQCAQASRRSSAYDKNSYSSYTSSPDNRYPLLNAIKDQVHRGNAAQFHSSPLAIAFAVICALILKVNN